MKTHPLYSEALRAYSWSSFWPEKRADSEIRYYEGVCSEFKELGKEGAIEKFTALFRKYLAARARCASPMITGSANFPVSRMEKYNRWERAAAERMYDFVKRVITPKVERTELNYGISAKEYEVAGVKILHNLEENRLQLFFEGKPEAETIKTLKKNGYKWSPRFKAWQRQLTPNAIRSLSSVIPQSTAA